jgi:hypothetical protein
MLSASGYGGLDATPLARPGYYNEIMARIYERDFLPEITNSDINEDVIKCHQQVQIMKAPEVGPWRTISKNQEMVPNQISAEAVSFEICNAAYNAIKIDQLDIEFACDRWDAFEEKFLDAVYESYVKYQRDWVLGRMVLECDPQNKGSACGKYGDIDLGSKGNPIVINKDNLSLQLANLQRVLIERLRWADNQMFLVVPTALKPILIQTNFANPEWTHKNPMLVDGMYENQLCGFNVITTTNLPVVKDDTGKICYYVIAGHRSAYAYASNIINSRVVESERTWSAEYQMLAVWGGKMLYPDALVVAYWTFDPK